MKLIDDFLNSITMYRLVLYYLIAVLLLAFILTFFHVLPFTFAALLFSTFFIFVVTLATNTVFAIVFKAPTNPESILISALILILIVTPANTLHDLPFIFWAAVWTAASKFIFAINKKHIFNPVAFGVFITSLALPASASWWVGTSYLLPVVLIGGILIVKKLRRFQFVLSFFAISLLTIFILSLTRNTNILSLLTKIFLDSPIIFFATVMLTEPLTTPPDGLYRFLYASLIGFLFAPQLHFGSIYTTPEMGLVIGNVFSYLLSPKEKLLLPLLEKIQLSSDTYDFIFRPAKKMQYIPGQYMEWMLPHKRMDVRGARRYLTLASSPTEDTMRIGVKFVSNGSTWKKALMELPNGGEIIAAQRAGEFVMPANVSQKLVFVAGGIGITPFRSMIKYLLDTKEKRDIVLVYLVPTEKDAVYMDVFKEAGLKFGLKIILQVSETMGRMTPQMLMEKIPDFKERQFYISGSHGMVDGFKNLLFESGVNRNHITTDYFPGYA